MAIYMIEEICNSSQFNNAGRMKFDRKSKKDIDFDQIVKFLNDQKAVMDYAGLN